MISVAISGKPYRHVVNRLAGRKPTVTFCPSRAPSLSPSTSLSSVVAQRLSTGPPEREEVAGRCQVAGETAGRDGVWGSLRRWCWSPPWVPSHRRSHLGTGRSGRVRAPPTSCSWAPRRWRAPRSDQRPGRHQPARPAAGQRAVGGEGRPRSGRAPLPQLVLGLRRPAHRPRGRRSGRHRRCDRRDTRHGVAPTGRPCTGRPTPRRGTGSRDTGLPGPPGRHLGAPRRDGEGR